MNINIKKTVPEATVPTRGSEYAAGYDLYACVTEAQAEPVLADVTSLDPDVEHEYSAIILPGQTNKVGTGICAEIPAGYFGAIFARSGLATKQGLRPANCVGVVDADYRGEIIVAVHNDSDEVRYIKHGDRIAQLVIIPFLPVEFTVVDELSETVRGDGGFGSTDLVIQNIADKWDNMGSDEREDVLNTLAGKVQFNDSDSTFSSGEFETPKYEQLTFFDV